MTDATISTRPRGRGPATVIVLCWATIMFDGYDLLMYGTVVPELLEYPDWSVSPEEAGRIGSWALVGMLVGALAAGTVTELVGRRKLLIFCQLCFSIAMGLAAIAPSPEALAAFRVLAGIGLGGAIPTAGALTLEYAPAARRHFVYALMFSGYSVGGILAALLGLVLIPELGFRAMFAVGLAPIVLLTPLTLRYLPESISFLRAKGRTAEAADLAARFGVPSQAAADDGPPRPERKLAPVLGLFGRDYVVGTIMLWGATFLGLLLVYGLGTWLTNIMRESGYNLGSSLVAVLALNLGAILGTIAAGPVGDRLGSRTVLSLAFLAAAVSNAALSLHLPLAATLLLLAFAGFGSIGTAVLMNVFVTSYYATASRASGLGWAVGVGRLGGILGPTLGGILAGSALGVEWNFYVFALVAVTGALLVALVPRSPVERGAPVHRRQPAGRRAAAHGTRGIAHGARE